ncbi:MAG: butyrate kinase [Acidobacteria bacterium]|nr:MAG: butyrate kinase [Acidobacteriota bacterium]
MSGVPNLLAIDPGSACTRVGLFCDAEPVLIRDLQHGKAALKACGPEVISQFQLRLLCIEIELESCGLKLDRIAAVAGRGGLLHPVPGGTYRVNEEMLEELRRAERGEHVANLGAFLAHAIASRMGVPAYIVDPISVDEWAKVARFSGCAQLERTCFSLALNCKAVARRFALEAGESYENLRLVVAHLGSGHTISAHALGRMIDSTNSREDGAFSTERSGSVPAMELVRLCFSGRYTQKQIENMLTREGGLVSYLGTGDLREVEQRIEQGDQYAGLVFRSMVYQIAKEIGAMSCALQGRVDAIVITGEMSHSRRLTCAVCEAVKWIAPIKVYPGGNELRALAEGVLRVMRNEEPGREFGDDVPETVMTNAGS